MKKKYRIYFYANLGNLNNAVYGGGEAGNRRTLELIKELGYDVVPINKYSKTTGNILIKGIKLVTKILLNLLQYCKILFRGQIENSVVHISGFYGVMVYWEYLLCLVAKSMGYKVLYEMRGGGADKQRGLPHKVLTTILDKTVING